MRTKFRILLIVAVLLLPSLIVSTLHAELSAVGPVDPANGFPAWYQDPAGLSLAPCFDNNGFCSITMTASPGFNPALPIVFPTNFPSEGFYFIAEANPGTTLYIAALEFAFANGTVSAGDKMVFSRIRFADRTAPAGTYTVTHPYGVDAIEVTPADVDAGVGLRFTEDIGIAPGNFTAALTGRIGPFLRNAGGLTTSPNGTAYIGDSVSPVAVAGTPVTSVTVAGPVSATTSTFILEGKVFTTTPEPPAGGVISGTVKNDSNLAIGNVRVQVYSPGAMPLPMPPMMVGETRTGMNGGYRISGLQTGAYFICFDGSAGNYINECYDNRPWNSWSDISSATLVDVASGQTTTLNDTLLTPGGGIAGTVTNSNGDGIATVSVIVYDSNNMWFKQVQTGPTGTYSVGGLPTGDYKVCFDASMMMTGYLNECYNDRAWGDIANATPVPVTAGQTAEVKASLMQGGVITGMVANGIGGIGNVWVQVFDTSGMPTPMPMPAGSMTDPGGTYRVGGLQTGVYRICFDGSSSGYIKECYNDKPWNTWSDIVSADTVTVTADQETALDVAVLTSGGTLTGRVTSDGTQGIPNVWVYVCQYDRMTGMCSYSGGMPTDPDGNYTVSGFASGSYKIWFDTSMLLMTGSNYLSQWYNNKVDEAGADLVTITAPAASTINVQLEQGGRISGTVTNGAAGIPGVSASVYDSNGMPLPMMGMGATTSPDGAFSVGGLRTGAYKVCFDGSSSGYINECYEDKPWNMWNDIASATSVSVVTGETTTLNEAVLAQGGTIWGFVKNEGETAIGMVNVSVYDSTNMWLRGAMTDPSGSYSIGGLPTGDYKVCFDARMTTAYLSECYNNQTWMDFANAMTVPVAAGQRVQIDAELAQGHYYDVWANWGPGGFISPPSQSVVNGSTAQFTISPYDGYEVASVSGCGGIWTGTNPYVTGPVNSDCMVTAEFSQTTREAYQFIGFLQPIMIDGSSIFKSGRTIPVKFQLTDGSGAFVTNASAILRVYKVSDDILGTTDVDSSGSANSDTSFRYDSASNQYIYNMSTSGLGAGTFVLRVDLDDGTSHEVRISLR